MNFNSVQHLTLISSESCNLKCAYCEIAKSETSLHCQEAKEVKEFMLNGKFFNNVKSTFERFKLDPEDIISISLWGQEPTLTLDAFQEMYKDLIKYFPNINSLFFSTNGMAYPERIANLAKLINDLNIKDDSFSFDLQVSYDGYYDTKYIRGANPDLILSNIEKLINMLKDMELEKLNFSINIHNVVTFDVINRCYTKENGIYHYWREFKEIDEKFKNLTNGYEHIKYHGTSPGMINPYNATKEDGQLFAKFIQDSMNECLDSNYYKTLLDQYAIDCLERFKNNEEFDKYLEHFFSASYDYTNCDLESIGCSVGNGDIKIRYDGRTIYCQNAFYAVNEEEINSVLTGLKKSVRKEQLRLAPYPNLVLDEKEKIDKYLYIWQSTNGPDCGPHLINLTLNYMILLAKAGQIDQKYLEDPHLLLRHAYIVGRSGICWDNHLMETGSIYNRPVGVIRLFCNGFMDLFEENLKENWKNRKEWENRQCISPNNCSIYGANI